MSEIHTIYFMENQGWTPIKAKDWLKKHNYKPIKPLHRMGHELRYRLRDPKLFKTFTTKKISDNGIYLVFGFR